MYKAKFIGGYMDGEVVTINKVTPTYHFPRMRPLSFKEIMKEDISKPLHWAEDYELDSWEGDRVFYRRVGLPPQ